MYRQAYEYFKAGEIEKAIETLDEAILDKQARESIAAIQQLKLDISITDTIQQNNTAEIQALIKRLFSTG